MADEEELRLRARARAKAELELEQENQANDPVTSKYNPEAVQDVLGQFANLPGQVARDQALASMPIVGGLVPLAQAIGLMETPEERANYLGQKLRDASGMEVDDTATPTSPFYENLIGGGFTGGLAVTSAKVAEKLGAEKLGQRVAGVLGSFAGETALDKAYRGPSGIPEQGPVGNAIASVGGAMAPEALSAGRALEEATLGKRVGTGTLGTGPSAEEQAFLNSRRVQDVSELENFQTQGAGQNAIDKMKAGRVTPDAIQQYKSGEALLFDQGASSADNKVRAAARILGANELDNNVSRGIAAKFKEKVLPYWGFVKNIFDADNIAGMREKAAAMGKEVLSTKEEMLARAGEVPIQPLRDAISEMKFQADEMAKLNDMKPVAQALREGLARTEADLEAYTLGAEKSQGRNYNGQFKEPEMQGGTIPATKLDEFNQLMNEFRRIYLEEFNNAKIGASDRGDPAGGAAATRRLAGVQEGIRTTLDKALRGPTGLPDAYTRTNGEFGALQAADQLLNERDVSIGRSTTMRSMTRATQQAGVEPGVNIFNALPKNLSQFGDALTALASKSETSKNIAQRGIASQLSPKTPEMLEKATNIINQGPGREFPVSQDMIASAQRGPLVRAASPIARGVVQATGAGAVQTGINAGMKTAVDVMKQSQQEAQTKAQNVYRLMPGQIDPYPQGFPRELTGLDPEVFADQFLQKAGTDPMKAIVAKQLIDSFSLAHKQNDVAKREKVYEAMATTFPELFKSGWGVNGRIWSKSAQQSYLARIQRDAGVDPQFLAQQKSSFNDRVNPKILQIPVKTVTQADVQAQQRAGQKRVELPDGSYDFRQ